MLYYLYLKPGAPAHSETEIDCPKVEIEVLAQLKDVSLLDRLFLKRYPFRKFGPGPGDRGIITPLKKPLKECTIALVTTAGLSLPDQPPFDETLKNGDTSFREFPANISPEILEMHQRSWSFDHTGVLQDRNLAFPLDRLRELRQRQEIGALAAHHYSFMGSIISPSKLIKETAPEVARRLKADAVDVVLLTPV